MPWVNRGCYLCSVLSFAENRRKQRGTRFVQGENNLSDARN
jgi:hypothetical protein